jgi:hypothetical protein
MGVDVVVVAAGAYANVPEKPAQAGDVMPSTAKGTSVKRFTTRLKFMPNLPVLLRNKRLLVCRKAG